MNTANRILGLAQFLTLLCNCASRFYVFCVPKLIWGNVATFTIKNKQ